MLDFHLCEQIMDNIAKVVVGKRAAMELMMVALLAEGHVLLEDVPGLGKTLMAKALAKGFTGIFKRVQFTPDILPADITGFNVFDQKAGRFVFQSGPVMSHILLADEINRAIPRTQSSLLESMEERQVTVDGQTIALPRPFFVVATQNPIELEGTFPLPEAQLDRFLLKIRLGYPSKAEEMEILARFRENDPLLAMDAVADPQMLVQLQQARAKIHVSDAIRDYITALVRATRESQAFRFGSSPRGSLGLMRAAQALAALRGRDYVLPDDVKYLAPFVLTHRLTLTEKDRLRGALPESFLERIIAETPVSV
jgi:MoxR-like ATPase